MNRLWVRLTAAFLLVALVAVALFALVMSRTVETQFRGYVGVQTSRAATERAVELLTQYYAENGSWAGVETLLLGGNGPSPGGRGTGPGQGQRHGMGGMMGAGMGGIRYALYDENGSLIAGTEPVSIGPTLSPAERERATPVQVNGQTVGWLVVQQPAQVLLDTAQAGSLRQVRRTLVIAGLIAAGLALIVGVAISQVITRPLARLTGAARAVAAGKLGEQVALPVGPAAEINTLARTFNEMSAALEKAEAQRVRLTADIAHELRTPISVMRAQLQAMLDGVYPTDTAHVAAVYEQTLHLARLVDDLHTLTRAETGHLPLAMQPLDPASLASRAAALFEPLVQDAGLALAVEIEPGLPTVRADADRLHQVLANLLGNALRHTPPGGEIRLGVAQAGDRVQFSVRNTGQTLTAEEAEHVFDRFWRADESRQRDGGGAGLGLAIARELVHLHGGRIRVETGQGETAFVFDVPVGKG